jgi:serine/threonine-protein kinase
MKKLDRFLLRDTLSDGPAGTVYKADEILPGDNRRTVALKVLPALAGAATGESPAEQRFFGEVRVLSQLAVHPHVVTIYAMGLTDGYPWLAMEYAAATAAGKMADGPGDPAEVAKLLEQVGRGLAAMHGLKPPLIHQDLKPANVLVDAVGNYKVTDFSLATVTAANKTHGLATVRYAAPELLSADFGRVGPWTDLYALGHMAYEMALGGRAHRGQFPAVFEGNSSKEPPPNKWMMWHASMNMRPAAASAVVKEFPAGLAEVIGRLMAKPLGERYASAEDLLSDLAVLRQDVPTTPPPSAAGVAVGPATAGGRGAGASGVRPAITEPAASRSGSGMVVPPPPPPAMSAPMAQPAATAGGASTAAGGGGRFWVRLRGKVTGPYDLATLQRQVKQGQVSRLHQVSADQVTWKQAAEIEGLYGPTVV